MRSAVLTGLRQIVVEDVPKPEPGEGWVLLRVEACGICGSDLRYFEGENPWSLHTLGYNKELPPRMVLGHEIAGTVVEVGPGGDEALIGQRAAALAFQVCGECGVCLRGLHNLCPNTMHLGHGAGFEDWDLNPGGYSEYCLLWEERVVPLPDDVSFEAGAFLDGLGVAVHAVAQSGLGPGDTALMLGCGPIGLLSAQVALAAGAEGVICSDLIPAARAHAKRLTGARLHDPESASLEDVVMDATGGHGVDVVLDTSSALEAQEAAIRSMAPGGRMIFLAKPADGLKLGLKELSGERSYSTSANNLYVETDDAVDLLASGAVQVDGLVTHRFPLDDIVEAIDTMARKEETGAYKIIIEP